MLAARSIAHQLLESDEDVDPRAAVARYTAPNTSFPGYSVEANGKHWRVYTNQRAWIGDVYPTDSVCSPVEHMSIEQRARIEANPWVALGLSNSDNAECSSFAGAVRALIDMNDRANNGPDAREESLEDADEPAGMVNRYATPTELVVKNQNGRTFRVLLSLESPRSADSDTVAGLPLVLPWIKSTRALADGLAQPMITFYDLDASSEKFPHGQKVSSYYASSLARHTNGLELYSDVPVWTVDADAMRQVSDWITDEIETKRGYVLKDDMIMGGVYVRPPVAEALDPDDPELLLKPELHAKQPPNEWLTSALRIMLRPYYDEITIQQKPYRYAEVLATCCPNFTEWTIHCKRHTPLKLPPREPGTPVANGFACGQKIDWRAQAEDWFQNWAVKNGLVLRKYAQHGRLRVDPMFTFETYTFVRPTQVAESDAEIGPEFYVSNMVQNATWVNDLHEALWKFHSTGIGWRIREMPNSLLVQAETMFNPLPSDFEGRLLAFVPSWLKERRVMEVRTAKSLSFFDPKSPVHYPTWTVLAMVNLNASVPAALPTAAGAGVLPAG